MTETNLLQLKSLFRKTLSERYSPDEIDDFFFRLCDAFCNLKRIDIALNEKHFIAEDRLQQLYDALSRLQKEEPLQYILGETEFYGLRFFVNEKVLIPRPETEELVDLIVKTFQQKDYRKPLKILDIGTGSGCIAVSLAKNLPGSELTAFDISKEALETANRNAHRNNTNIKLKEFDILTEVEYPEKFDLIVSNPPYVKESEKKLMRNNVLKFEPQLALFVTDRDPLLFYRKIALFSKSHLRAGGKLYFEINREYGKAITELLHRSGYQNINLIKDIFGADRIIYATLPPDESS